jgi:hypothetical protein
VSRIVCPHCGYAGGGTATDIHGENGGEECNGFYLLEDITTYRFVKGVEGDQLVVNAHYQTGEGYDAGVEGTIRLECRRCLGEFPLPAGLEVEWE